MKRLFLSFAAVFIILHIHAQQINGVFTDFAKNNQWGSTAINTATLETSGYITLGGYYQGRGPEKKTPMLLQINNTGVIRSDFGGAGVALLSFVNSSNGSTQIDRAFIANTSSTANNNQFIIAGHEDDGDGFYFKMFGSGQRPTAFNAGNITTLSGGTASATGYIDDWVTGSFVYGIRFNGVSFTETKILLSSFNKETGAPLASFGDNGVLRISAPDDYVIDQARPSKMTLSTNGLHFYVAFSVVPRLGTNIGIALCRINSAGGTIDSSFGTNGYKVFATSSRYYVTSVLANADQSITVSGYGGDGMASFPSFHSFRADGSITLAGYNYLLGEPYPGYGSKNISAKKATLNGQERIVFAYAHPINSNDQFRIAIASYSPSSGTGSDPLLHTPWLGSEFISAEPTCIVTLPGNAGFLVTGKATRSNGTFAGVVLKYTTIGTLDPGFANAGVLIINGRSGGAQWNHATQLSTGKYIAVGGAEFIPGDFSKKAILLNRFNSDGGIDSSFGINGSQYRFQSENARVGSRVVALPGGEFLVEGSYVCTINEPGTAGSGGNEGVIYKFNADGTPYTSFGPYNNGRYHMANVSLGNMKVIDHNIFFSGGTGVYKLSPAGNLLSSYATTLNLVQEYTLNAGSGVLYAGGRMNSVTAKQVLKVNPGGSIDASFGNSGYVSIPIISSGDNANINELVEKPGGGLFAVMQWNNSAVTSYGIFFSSISNTGILDQNFGTNGAKFLQLPGASNIIASRYKWTGANKDSLLIFGQATVNSARKGFVCKVDINGDLIASFGTNGVIWTTETWAATIGFDNSGNAMALPNYGFYNGTSIAKVKIPADVYNHIRPGSWTGSIDNDWFKPGNWAHGLVPDAFTAVTIANGNVLIGAGMHAYAWSVSVGAGADLTIGTNSLLDITSEP